MVRTVALRTPPVRIGQHLLAYRLATALCVESIEFREKLLDANDLQPMPGSPEEFGRYVDADATKWGRITKDAKITVE